MHYEDKKTGFKFDAVIGLPKENTAEAFEELFAANKAAEEGELPALMELRDRISEMREASYTISQYPETAQVVFDSVTEALDEIAADRASRQVANKAEVEPVGVIVADDPVYGWHMHALKPWNEIGAGTKLCATPPATTGASTVLTDERIGETVTMKRSEYLADRDACFQRGKEHGQKLVAAQAGQVAVPEDALRVVRRLLDGSQPQDVPGALMVIDTALAGGAA